MSVIYHVSQILTELHSRNNLTKEMEQQVWNEWKTLIRSWVDILDGKEIWSLDTIFSKTHENALTRDSLEASVDSVERLVLQDLHYLGLSTDQLDTASAFPPRLLSLSELTKRIGRMLEKSKHVLNTRSGEIVVDLYALKICLMLMRPLLLAFLINLSRELSPHLSYWERIRSSTTSKLLLTTSYFPYHCCLLSVYYGRLFYRKYLWKGVKDENEQMALPVLPSLFFYSDCSFRITKLRGLARLIEDTITEFSIAAADKDIGDTRLYINSKLKLFSKTVRLGEESVVSEDQRNIEPPKQLYCLLCSIQQYVLQFESRLSHYKAPSFIVKYWVPTGFALITLYKTLRTIHVNYERILHWMSESKEATTAFLAHWIWEPLLEIWDTIRYKSNKMAITKANSLSSDLDSLERMVVDFATKNPQLLGTHSTLDTDTLIKNVRSGDLGIILRKYESEITSPVKNMILGDLITLILIQVQKSKVDLQLAMSALDKLLKSNELNFEFLAIFPSLAILYFLTQKGRGLLKYLKGASSSNLWEKMRIELRKLHMILHESGDGGSHHNYGRILIHGTLLMELGACLFENHSVLRDWLCEDLGIILNLYSDPSARLSSLERLMHSIPFFKTCC